MSIERKIYENDIFAHFTNPTDEMMDSLMFTTDEFGFSHFANGRPVYVDRSPFFVDAKSYIASGLPIDDVKFFFYSCDWIGGDTMCGSKRVLMEVIAKIERREIMKAASDSEDSKSKKRKGI